MKVRPVGPADGYPNGSCWLCYRRNVMHVTAAWTVDLDQELGVSLKVCAGCGPDERAAALAVLRMLLVVQPPGFWIETPEQELWVRATLVELEARA